MLLLPFLLFLPFLQPGAKKQAQVYPIAPGLAIVGTNNLCTEKLKPAQTHLVRSRSFVDSLFPKMHAKLFLTAVVGIQWILQYLSLLMPLGFGKR